MDRVVVDIMIRARSDPDTVRSKRRAETAGARRLVIDNAGDEIVANRMGASRHTGHVDPESGPGRRVVISDPIDLVPFDRRAGRIRRVYTDVYTVPRRARCHEALDIDGVIPDDSVGRTICGY